MEMAVKKWLKYTSDRNGGRKKRALKKQRRFLNYLMCNIIWFPSHDLIY